MTKVYANEVGYVIESKEMVEVVQELRELRKSNYAKYILIFKELGNKIREDLEISNLISINILDESTVGILTYNIVAGQFDVFIQGKDEIGFYIEIGE